MKKFIYSLSFAVACGFAVNAANVATPQVAMSAKAFQSVQLPQGPVEFERISDDGLRKAKRQAATAADFVGTYKWSGRSQLSSEFFPNEGVMTITASESNPNKLYVQGFCAAFIEDPENPGYGIIQADGTILDAEFDPATGHLIIPNQDAFYMNYYGQMTQFVNYTVRKGSYVDDETGEEEYGYLIMEAPEGYPYYFTLTDYGIKAGNIDAEKWGDYTYTDAELLQDVCLATCRVYDAAQNDYGFQWFCNSVAGSRLNEFSFIEDEWQKLGEAEFTDAWFPVFWDNGNPEPYSVDLYYDKSQPGRYLLNNPYGTNTPYEDLNISNIPGYLVFDITDPECVVFEPLIYAATFDMGMEDEVEADPFYCCNFEGNAYYMQGATKEEIIIYMYNQDMDITSLNQRQRTVYIYNALFTIGLNVTYMSWQNAMMEGSIVLPENYMDAVDTVLGEDADVPAVYYNLQGQRVNNPEKGQLLIVKKGNKAYKQIMR